MDQINIILQMVKLLAQISISDISQLITILCNYEQQNNGVGHKTDSVIGTYGHFTTISNHYYTCSSTQRQLKEP